MLRLLINKHTNQELQVRWETQKSTTVTYSGSNGVEKSGVLFPILFTLYMYINELLQEFEEKGAGCRVV